MRAAVLDVIDASAPAWLLALAVERLSIGDTAEQMVALGAVVRCGCPSARAAAARWIAAQKGAWSFLYADPTSCKVTGGWALELDGDNVFCGAVFKMGATAGWDANTCGPEDWGFLNDCDCDDEHCELYYR